MRDFQLPGRSPALATSAMAATSHPLATLTALDVLRAGGTAADAAVAACAVQCVVEPQMTGIGGDCWVLYAPAGGGVDALNGSGWAPAAISLERLRAEGLTEMPDGGAHSVTVPGAIRSWQALLDKRGSKSLDELLQPAIRFARDGYPVHPKVAFDWNRAAWRLERSAAGRAIYLPGGKAPAMGDTMRLEKLAQTLETIARRGADAFYEGPLAAAMVASLKSFGGLHGEADFADFQPEWVEPISATYKGVRVFECPPNGQGVIALLMLQILEQFDHAGLDPNGPERLHLEAEVTRLAFRDRDAAVDDPLGNLSGPGRIADLAHRRECGGVRCRLQHVLGRVGTAEIDGESPHAEQHGGAGCHERQHRRRLVAQKLRRTRHFLISSAGHRYATMRPTSFRIVNTACRSGMPPVSTNRRPQADAQRGLPSEGEAFARSPLQRPTGTDRGREAGSREAGSRDDGSEAGRPASVPASDRERAPIAEPCRAAVPKSLKSRPNHDPAHHFTSLLATHFPHDQHARSAGQSRRTRRAEDQPHHAAGHDGATPLDRRSPDGENPKTPQAALAAARPAPAAADPH